MTPPKHLTRTLVLLMLCITVHALDAPDHEKPRKEQTFNVTFRGGSVHRLVQQLNKDSRGAINVVVSAEAKKFEIDELKLKSVSAADVIRAVAKAYPRLELTKQGTIHILTVRPLGERRVRMFSLKSVLKTVKIEDVNTLIHNAWELTEIGNKAKLRFHPETKILIVAGTTTEIQAVETVLAQLETKLTVAGDDAKE